MESLQIIFMLPLLILFIIFYNPFTFLVTMGIMAYALFRNMNKDDEPSHWGSF